MVRLGIYVFGEEYPRTYHTPDLLINCWSTDLVAIKSVVKSASALYDRNYDIDSSRKDKVSYIIEALDASGLAYDSLISNYESMYV